MLAQGLDEESHYLCLISTNMTARICHVFCFVEQKGCALRCWHAPLTRCTRTHRFQMTYPYREHRAYYCMVGRPPAYAALSQSHSLLSFERQMMNDGNAYCCSKRWRHTER